MKPLSRDCTFRDWLIVYGSTMGLTKDACIAVEISQFTIWELDSFCGIVTHLLQSLYIDVTHSLMPNLQRLLCQEGYIEFPVLVHHIQPPYYSGFHKQFIFVSGAHLIAIFGSYVKFVF